MKTLFTVTIPFIIIHIFATTACAFEIDIVDVGVTIFRVLSTVING